MKEFITETVQVLLPARMPGTRSDRSGNGRAAAFRCALLAFLLLGLLGGIGQAQEPLKIDSNGDVSIAKKLTVNGGANVPGNVDIGTLNFPALLGGDKISLFGKTGGANYGFSIGHHSLQIHTDTSVAAILFGYKDNKGFTEAMRIEGTGNVGIGKTPDENAKLDVAGNANFSGNVGIGKTPDENAKLDVAGNANFSGLLVGNNSLIGKKANAFLRFDGTHVVLNAAESGNVYLGYDQGKEIHFGVGGTKMVLTSKGDLFVDGTVRYRWGTQWKELYQERDGWAGSRDTSPPSDRRLKTDLHPLPSALEKISQLRGVTFRWNERGLQYLTRDIESTLSAGPGASDEDNRKLWQAERGKRYKELSKTNVGVVAQDVEAVLPQAVTTDASGYKLVNYTDLIPLVIEALKEEDKVIQEQARTIASQQTEIQRLTVSSQAAQRQLNELQEVKQKLGLLEATVNRFLASGVSADADKTGTSELLAGARPSEPQ